MSATVVNIKTVREDFDVYIGRACCRSSIERAHTESVWANSFKAGKHGIRTVEESIERYERELRARVNDPWVRKRLMLLDGKRLGCWCAPDPCHGDAIIRVLEDIKAGAL